MGSLMDDFETPVRTTKYGLNDDGNAQYFADTYKETVRYCPQTKDWRSWDGARWAVDDGDTPLGLARDLMRQWATEAVNETQQKFRHSCLNAARLQNMVRLARTDLRANINMFDVDPYALNTPSGVVNLISGELEPHRRDAFMSRITMVGPNFQDPMPEFERFMQWVFQGNQESIDYIQTLLGISLIGKSGIEHVLPFLYGHGRNGKSTLLNLVLEILGTERNVNYGWKTGSQFLMSTRLEKHPQEIACLKGARFVVCSEIEATDYLNESRVKDLTGGDTLNGHFMGENDFSFIPSHTIWAFGNHKPNIRTGSEGLWARIKLIEFGNKVTDADRDPLLPDKLKLESSQILAWMIRGAQRYLNQAIALKTPSSVADATRDYADEEDEIGFFLESCVVEAPGAQLSVSDMRSAYVDWCEDRRQNPKGPKTFAQEITGRKVGNVVVEQKRTTTKDRRTVRYYPDLRAVRDGIRL